MIYFYDDLVAKTVETIKESYDFADILNDLNRINQAITNIKPELFAQAQLIVQ